MRAFNSVYLAVLAFCRRLRCARVRPGLLDKYWID